MPQPEAGRPTPETETLLLELLYRALVEIRLRAYEQNNDAIAALADAMHNVPHLLRDDDFHLSWLRADLAKYQSGVTTVFDYVGAIDALANPRERDPSR